SGVFKGYRGQPDITAKAKVTLLNVGPGLFMRTGDLAYYNDVGDLVYVGRDDFRVKIFGQLVAPEEIEQTVIRASKHVEACIVRIESDCYDDRNHDYSEYWSCHILAPTISSAYHAHFIRHLETYCRQNLSSSMLPAAWKIYDEFPYLSVGKIDRCGFPKLERTGTVILSVDKSIEFESANYERIIHNCSQAYYLYEYHLGENIFRDYYTDIMTDLSNLNIEGVHEMNVPLDFHLLYLVEYIIYNTIEYCERGQNKYRIKCDINDKKVTIEMKNEQEIAVLNAFAGQSTLPENLSFSLDKHVSEERGVLTPIANTVAFTKSEKGPTIENMLIQNAACGVISDGEVTGEKSIDPLKQVNKAAAKTTNMNFDRRRAAP
ncbi:unnamed protein product, partial [Rotaria magnacalcarata]